MFDARDSPSVRNGFVAFTFAALVVATSAALIVAQRLKTAPSRVQDLRATRLFSPNRDGRKDVARIGFLLPETAIVAVEIIDDADKRVAVVRRAARSQRYRRVRMVWRGRDESGRPAPDGRYRARLIRDSTPLLLPLSIQLDTTPPEAGVNVVRLELPIARLRLVGTGRRRTLTVFRRSNGGGTQAGRPRVLPFGTTNATQVLPAGASDLVIDLALQDKAGNIGHSSRWDRRTGTPTADTPPNVLR